MAYLGMTNGAGPSRIIALADFRVRKMNSLFSRADNLYNYSYYILLYVFS